MISEFRGYFRNFGAAAVLDTAQEQDQQANQAAGPASNTSKQEQQARPVFSGFYIQISDVTLKNF